MKNFHTAPGQLKIVIMMLATFFLNSCDNWSVPKELIGNWKSNKFIATVRTEPVNHKFTVASDSTVISIKINKDNTVTGSIGFAEISGGIICMNEGLLPPSIKGIVQVIDCGPIGKIFTNDPLEVKQIQIWFGSMKENEIEAELRNTGSSSDVPIASLKLKKVKD